MAETAVVGASPTINAIRQAVDGMTASLVRLKDARDKMRKTMPEFGDNVAVLDAQISKITLALQTIMTTFGLR